MQLAGGTLASGTRNASLAPRTAVLFIYLVTLSLGLGAVNLSDATLGQSLVILVQFLGLVALVLILMFVDRDKVSEG